MLTPTFYKRTDHTTPITPPPGTYTCDGKLRFEAQGGPTDTRIRVKGSPHALRQWLELLATDVVIFDELGIKRWWGFVYSAKVRVGRVWLGKSLEGMANKLSCIYDQGGDAVFSSYSSADTDLSNDGIIIESIESLEKITDADEVARQMAIMLNQTKYPSRILEISDDDEYDCELECKGHYEKLAWINVTDDSIGAEQDATGGFDVNTNMQDWGDEIGNNGLGIEKWAVAFTATQSFYVNTLGAWVGGVGAVPVWLRLYNYTAETTPTAGSLFCSASGYPEIGGRKDYAADTNAFVESGCAYYLTITGEWQGISNRHYVLGTTACTTGGVVWRYAVGAWQSIPEKYPSLGKPLFWLTGIIENAKHMANIVMSASLAADVDFETTGLTTNPYEDGTRTVKEIVETLCEVGTSNTRRMWASFNSDRVLQIKEEPVKSKTTARYALNEKGELTYADGTKPVFDNPCGNWCVFTGMAFPDNLDDDPGIFFIESAEWDAESKSWELTARTQRDELDFWRTANA